jgi:hypothetical protein
VRLARFFTELRDPLHSLYGSDPRFAEAWPALLRAIAATAAARSPELRGLDHEREITPDWLQREQAIGYVACGDRFAALDGVREQVPYLRELGVTYQAARESDARRPGVRGRASTPTRACERRVPPPWRLTSWGDAPCASVRSARAAGAGAGRAASVAPEERPRSPAWAAECSAAAAAPGAQRAIAKRWATSSS